MNWIQVTLFEAKMAQKLGIGRLHLGSLNERQRNTNEEDWTSGLFFHDNFSHGWNMYIHKKHINKIRTKLSKLFYDEA